MPRAPRQFVIEKVEEGKRLYLEHVDGVAADWTTEKERALRFTDGTRDMAFAIAKRLRKKTPPAKLETMPRWRAGHVRTYAGNPKRVEGHFVPRKIRVEPRQMHSHAAVKVLK